LHSEELASLLHFLQRRRGFVSGSQQPATILVVDDEELVLDFVGAVLRRAGYDVLAADGAAAAIRLYRRHRSAIGLLLTDVQMPGMSGVELAEHIRGLEPHVPVLLMSGTASAAATGFDFVPKPFTHSELLSKTAQILASRDHSGAQQSSGAQA
jgi:DNA-binding NtrC family response regulator